MYGESISEMLTVQYRMHAAIMDWSSQELYNGKLSAHASVASHTLSDMQAKFSYPASLPSGGYQEIHSGLPNGYSVQPADHSDWHALRECTRGISCRVLIQSAGISGAHPDMQCSWQSTAVEIIDAGLFCRLCCAR